jgi:hypothetical protein
MHLTSLTSHPSSFIHHRLQKILPPPKREEQQRPLNSKIFANRDIPYLPFPSLPFPSLSILSSPSKKKISINVVLVLRSKNEIKEIKREGKSRFAGAHSYSYNLSNYRLLTTSIQSLLGRLAPVASSSFRFLFFILFYFFLTYYVCTSRSRSRALLPLDFQ